MTPHDIDLQLQMQGYWAAHLAKCHGQVLITWITDSFQALWRVNSLRITRQMLQCNATLITIQVTTTTLGGCSSCLQVWSTALKPDSSLLSPQTLAKLSRDEAASVAQLCRLLLLQHPHELDQDTTAAVGRLLVALLLHHAGSVRLAAKQAA